MVNYVIIGNSTAAIGAVEGIRQVDKKGGIALISNETHHIYSRPLISYLLSGKATQESMRYRGHSFYEDNGCTLESGVTVTGIDTDARLVILEDGRKIRYDKLLVATGSLPFVPAFEGLDTVPDKHGFMCLDDALRLGEALSKDKRVLIMGAGLIGLKCAEGIFGKVAHVTVVDLAPRILSSILDEEGAALVQSHLEGKGIEFKLANSARRFEQNTAVLNDNSRMDFDLLVLAVGVRPNTALLAPIAQVDRGIVINEKSETSVPDVYAAGDCTQTLDVSSGQSKVMALLPNAYMQGHCAGVNMAGGEASFDKVIPMNALGFFGLHIITAGSYEGEVYARSEGDNYKRLFYGDNRLRGYILIGNVEKAGIYTSLIRERTALDSIDFKLICEKPGLMAFTKEERMAKLGGSVR